MDLIKGKSRGQKQHLAGGGNGDIRGFVGHHKGSAPTEQLVFTVLGSFRECVHANHNWISGNTFQT